MPGDDKLSISDFAKKIKQKYPEYQDVNDTLLTQKIITKYPEYSDMVDYSEQPQTVTQSRSVQNNHFLNIGEPEQPKAVVNKAGMPIGVKPVTTTEKPNIKEAIDKATEDYSNKFKTSKEFAKQSVEADYKQGNLVPVKENGESVMKKGTGIIGSFTHAVKQEHDQELENNYLFNASKDDAIKYLNMSKTNPELAISKLSKTEPSGILGQITDFLGKNAEILAKGTVGAVGGTALAPETAGASFGTFLSTVKEMGQGAYSSTLKNNYNALKEQDPNISDNEAYDKANKSALAGEVVGIGTGAILAKGVLPKIPEPTIPVNSVLNGIKTSASHAVESAPLTVGSAAAGSVLTDLASMSQGVHKDASEILDNASESAKNMAVMHFGLWALPEIIKQTANIPSYLKPQVENIVASAPREEVNNFYKAAEENKIIPEGTTEAVNNRLNEFDAQKKVVEDLPIDEEQKAVIANRLTDQKTQPNAQEEIKTEKPVSEAMGGDITNNEPIPTEEKGVTEKVIPENIQGTEDHPEIIKLQHERDANVKQALKSELKTGRIAPKEFKKALENAPKEADIEGLNERHENIIAGEKILKQLIDCL